MRVTRVVVVVVVVLAAGGCLLRNSSQDRTNFAKAADAFIDDANDFKTALPNDTAEVAKFLDKDADKLVAQMKDALPNLEEQAGKLDGEAGDIADAFTKEAEKVTRTAKDLVTALGGTDTDAFTAANDANAKAIERLNDQVEKYNDLK